MAARLWAGKRTESEATGDDAGVVEQPVGAAGEAGSGGQIQRAAESEVAPTVAAAVLEGANRVSAVVDPLARTRLPEMPRVVWAGD